MIKFKVGDKVKIVGFARSDAYYKDRKNIIGLTGVLTEVIHHWRTYISCKITMDTNIILPGIKVFHGVILELNE